MTAVGNSIATSISSLPSSSANKDLRPGKRKRVISVAKERNQHAVGKRVKLVYTATLPQKLLGCTSGDCGTVLTTKSIDMKANLFTYEEIKPHDLLKRMIAIPNNTKVSHDLSDKSHSLPILASKDEPTTTRIHETNEQTSGMTNTDMNEVETESESSIVYETKPDSAEQFHSSNDADNISRNINGSENPPVFLNVSRTRESASDIHDIICSAVHENNQTPQKVPCAEKQLLESTMESCNTNPDGRIENDDGDEKDNKVGNDATPGENNILKQGATMNLAKSVLKSETDDSVHSVCITPAARNTNSSGLKSTNNKKTGSGDVAEEKKKSGINIKTISTGDLMKFLSRYNLTLKAIPVDSNLGTMNTGSLKLRTVAVNTDNTGVKFLPANNSMVNGKTRIRAAIPVESKAVRNLKLGNAYKDACPKNPLSTPELRCVGNTVFRTTPQGTFSDWKMDGARSAKLCKRPTRFTFNGDLRQLHTKSIKKSDSALKTGDNSLRRRTKQANALQDVAVNTHNRSKLSDASCFQCPVKMFPLSTAFLDLEARDKATRETLEASTLCDTDLSMKSTAGQDICLHSPTMQNLVSKGSYRRLSGEFQSDPVLTSAVYFDNVDVDCDEFSDDFALSNVLLPKKNARNSLMGTQRPKDEECMEEKSNLRKSEDNEDYIPNMGDSDIAERTLSYDRSCDTDFLSFYEFPDSDTDSDVDGKILNIDLKSTRGDTARSTPTKQNGDCITHCTAGEMSSDSESQYEKDSLVMTPKNSKRDFHYSKCDISEYKERKRVLSSGSSYPVKKVYSSHCSSTECVTSYDEGCTSTSESTQVKTGLDNKDKSDNTQHNSLPTKPLEKWNSEEVSSWLTKTIQHYELVKTSCLREASENVDESQSEKSEKSTGTLFSRTTDGRALRDLDLDKLREYCECDSLASHLFQQIQELRVVGVSEIESSDHNKDIMFHHHRAQCVVASPPYVPVTSAEQLEESVNFEDLLGSDNILSSLDLTDVLDSNAHGSFLKSLSQDNEYRFYAQQRACNSSMFPEIYNHFSPVRRTPSIEETVPFNFKLHCRPGVYVNSSTVVRSGEYCQRDEFYEEFRSLSQRYDGHEFLNTHYEGSVPSTPITTLCPPMSPSTFYNLPPVVAKLDCTQGSSANIVKSESNSEFPSAGEILSSSSTVSSRESAMSDTDSGIHSPDSTPNKYALVGTVTNTVDYRGENNTSHLIDRAWLVRNGHIAPSTYDTSANTQAMKVVAMSGESYMAEIRSESSMDSNEEAWESASTSSTTSTLSVESETKLFNMDDCKTYIAGRPLHSLRTYNCSLQEDADPSSITDGAVNGNVVFVPSSQNDNATTNPSSTYHMVHAQNVVKGPQFVTQGNITTVYPSFVSHVRRVNPTTQGCGLPSKENVERSLIKYAESIDASAMKEQSNSIRGTKNRRFSKFNSHNASLIVDGKGRRHTCDGQDAAFIDSFDFKVRRTAGKSIHLWEFIRDTLLNPQYCPRLIKWEDRVAGIFRFVQSDVVAGMWGEKKNNPKMTYEKLSRAMRYYYNRGILERVDGRRLVYKFGKNAHGWQQTGESNDTKEAEQEAPGNVKEEKVPESNFPQQKNTTPSPRRTAACRIAVSMSNDVLPSPRKRRRRSNNNTQRNLCPPDIADQSKSAGTQTPPALKAKIIQVKKECEKLLEVKHEPYESAATPEAQPTPCIVYVASQTQVTPMENHQSEKDDRDLREKEAALWSLKHTITSPDRSSKLPSAEVLLGKHYKIATVAI